MANSRSARRSRFAAWQNRPSGACPDDTGGGWGLPDAGEPTVHPRGLADRRPRTPRRRRTDRLRAGFGASRVSRGSEVAAIATAVRHRSPHSSSREHVPAHPFPRRAGDWSCPRRALGARRHTAQPEIGRRDSPVSTSACVIRVGPKRPPAHLCAWCLSSWPAASRHVSGRVRARSISRRAEAGPPRTGPASRTAWATQDPRHPARGHERSQVLKPLPGL